MVPIINENDSVAVEEIEFGDNDNLSAMITLMMDADLLINLTDIDGFYSTDPRVDAGAELIPAVARIDRRIERLAGTIPGPLGRGGMISKIRAARKVTTAGVPMVIANGKGTDVLLKLFDGQELGTFFAPKREKLSSRKCWIAFHSKVQGRLRIDGGAVEAVVSRGKSLLPIGVTAVEGRFNTGASVEFVDGEDRVVGVGLVNYRADDIRKIRGLKSGQIEQVLGSKPYDEVIHRNNLAITGA